MIDAIARSELASRIDQLIVGESSCNDLFDGDHRHWFDSADRGVTEVAEALLDLCLDAGDSEVEAARSDLERCRSFLRSDLEYEWPRGDLGLGAMAGCVTFLGVPGLIALLVTGLVQLLQADFEGFVMILSLGVFVGVFVATFFVAVWQEHRKFKSAGDFGFWPFLCQSDWEAAQVERDV